MDDSKKKMVQFDNRVSWMDMVAIGGAALAIANSFYGTGKEVQVNTAAIKANQVAIERIEDLLEDRDERIFKEIFRAQASIETVRVESAEGRRRIEDKIDSLIARELDGIRVRDQ